MVFEVLDMLITLIWLLQCILVSEYHIIPHKNTYYVSVKKNVYLFLKCSLWLYSWSLGFGIVRARRPRTFRFNTETQEPVLNLYGRPQKPVHTVHNEGLILRIPQPSANGSHCGIFRPRPGYKTETHYALFQPWCGGSKTVLPSAWQGMFSPKEILRVHWKFISVPVSPFASFQ